MSASHLAPLDSSPGNRHPSTLLPEGTSGLAPLRDVGAPSASAPLARGRVAYERVGPDGAPLVVVLGGISAGRHVTAHRRDRRAGWWQGLVSADRAVDPTALQVVSIDYLDGNGGSARGRGTNPDAHGTVTTADQADAVCAVLDHLGAPAADLVLGASYGGMVGLAIAYRHPTRVRHLITISGGHRPHPQSTAWRTVQRAIVRHGRRHGGADEALALARGLAMVTYRTPEELAARFDGPPRSTADGPRFPIDDYLEHCGRRFAGRFRPEAFLQLSASIDLHRVDPTAIELPTAVVAVLEDQLVPAAHLRELAEALPRGELVELSSIFGHDAFLKETDHLDALLGQRLNRWGIR